MISLFIIFFLLLFCRSLFLSFARAGCATTGSIEADLIRDPDMISKVLAELTATAQSRGIPSEEIPRAVALLNTPWSPQHHGLLNLHFKKIRARFLQVFSDLLEDLLQQTDSA